MGLNSTAVVESINEANGVQTSFKEGETPHMVPPPRMAEPTVF